MIGFELSYRLIDCPLCWQNFITAAQEFFWEDVAVRRIDAMLKPFGGKYIMTGENGFIEFKSEQDYTLFVLRWS